jgi:hypothetical protein
LCGGMHLGVRAFHKAALALSLPHLLWDASASRGPELLKWPAGS